jgi:hypothetical protein
VLELLHDLTVRICTFFFNAANGVADGGPPGSNLSRDGQSVVAGRRGGVLQENIFGVQSRPSLRRWRLGGAALHGHGDYSKTCTTPAEGGVCGPCFARYLLPPVRGSAPGSGICSHVRYGNRAADLVAKLIALGLLPSFLLGMCCPV